MLVIGLDIASVTGAAVFDDQKPISAIMPWSFKLKGCSHEEKSADMGRQMVAIIRKFKPDLVAIEAPLKNIVRHKKQKTDLGGEHITETVNPASVILPNQLAGAAIAICGAYNLPHAIIAVPTWRKQFLGFSRKPGWSRDDYKKACRTRCEQLNIVCTNNDQADAVGVAFAAPATPMFKELRHHMQRAA